MQISRSLFLFGAIALIGAGCAEPQPAPVQPPLPAPQPVQPLDSPTTTTMNYDALKFPGILPDAEIANKVARIKTSKGDIVFELLPKEGPNAASNFVYLAKQKFYDGLLFHRVIEGFMAQGGDPKTRLPENPSNIHGTGGPGYEFMNDPVKLPYKKGIVAMANAGRDTNGSQFFIMKEDYPLDPDYSIFGRVISGQEVVNALRIGDAMTSVTIEDKK